MGTYIGRNHGPVHTGKGDMYVTVGPDGVQASSGRHYGEGNEILTTDDGKVYVNGQLVEDDD